MQYRDKPIQFSLLAMPGSHGVFAPLRQRGFKNALSNLIDNAVQSISQGSGSVGIEISEVESTVQVRVTDTGKGIAKERLALLGSRGATFDKPGGSGLGLWNAKEVMTAVGGYLSLSSEEGKGTVVTLTLPKAEAPSWALGELRVPTVGTIVLLDDDREMHEIWKERLSLLGAERVVSFFKISDLREWISHNDAPALFLCDFELIGQQQTGVEVIEELGLSDKAVLVTSHHEDPKVQATCERLKVKLLPKDHLALIPINPVAASEEGQSHA